MCCGTKRHHGGFCGCAGYSHFGCRFLTKDEKATWLEQYLESLQEEAKAVEERITALKEEQ
jgi:hypothetical protein